MKKKLIAAAGILGALAVGEWIREIRSFRVTRYRIQSEKLNQLGRSRKIIMLSDLHNQNYGRENEKLLNAIRAEKPDLILIAGDMLIGKKGVSAAAAEKFVGKLPEICETYYENGNHEHRMKENPGKYGWIYQYYRRSLMKKGVHFLENEKAELLWENIPVEIYGLELPQRYYEKWKPVSLSVKEMEECIGKAAGEPYKILLAHNPTFVPTYLKWGADLVLSGHLHGGIVRIPRLGGLMSPQLKLFPKYSGEYTREGDKSVVVSKGLGMHTLKVRFLNPAEMIVLETGGAK